MKKFKSFFVKKAKDQGGQGMAEYVLLIVVVVGVAFMFKDKIRSMVAGKMDSISTEFQGFQSQ